MVYRNLCGDSVSLLGFGFLRLPTIKGKVDYNRLQPMVDYAIDKGVNYFETAYVYMNGNSEIALGRTLARHDRKKIVVSTKLWMDNIYSKEEMDFIFNKQLHRLNTYYIDNYLFHAVRKHSWKNFEASGFYDFLLEKKQKGQIRHVGFSFHDTPEFLHQIVSAYDWDFCQLQLNYMDWGVQKAEEQYRICAVKGLPIVVMEPVRGGELACLPEDVRGILYRQSATQSVTQASYALRWAASLSQVSCVLSGMSHMQHVNDNIETITNFRPITTVEQENINEAVKAYLALGTISCTACGYCVPACPKGIDIPTILTRYNYHLRTGDKILLMTANSISNYGCTKCGTCLLNCPQHVDISGELEKIAAFMQKNWPLKSKLKASIEQILPRAMAEFLLKCYRKATRV